MDGGSAEIASIQETLAARPPVLALRAVPNAQTIAAYCDATCLMDGEMALLSPGVEPKDLRRLGETLGYRVDISLAAGHPGRGPRCPVQGRRRSPRANAGKRRRHGRQCRRLEARWTARFVNASCGASVRHSRPSWHAPFIPQDIVLDRRLANDSVRQARPAEITWHSLGEEPGRHRPAPRNARERILCVIVADLLSLDAVDLDGNFFHLGGDSISSIRLVSLAREQGLVLSPRDVFLHPVLRDLAAAAHFGPEEPEQAGCGGR